MWDVSEVEIGKQAKNICAQFKTSIAEQLVYNALKRPVLKFREMITQLKIYPKLVLTPGLEVQWNASSVLY